MPPRIFISYRRDDSPGSAGRLYDRLAEEFPKDHLFMDVDAIAPGVDFVSEIESSVTKCDVLLAIIGRNWIAAADAQGRRRLDDPADFVRHEIATALKSGVRVIPVLVDGAAVPAASALPDDLQPLVRRNAVVLSHHRFTAETRALARAFATEMDAPWRASDAAAQTVVAAAVARPIPSWRIAGMAATVFAIIASGSIAGYFFAREGAEYWFTRIDLPFQAWVVLNLMVGPALALKLWMPRLSTQMFWGVVGATFGALVTLTALQIGLQATLLPGVSDNASGIARLLLEMGLVHTPSALGAGLVLGYFLAQALRGWFPHDGGRGFTGRMILIWMATGTIYAVATFLLISIGEAAASRPADAGAVAGTEPMRLWTDTFVFGAAWALGLVLTLRFGPRPGPRPALR